MNNFDRQYKALVKDILDNGTDREDRTGIGSRTTFGQKISVDLAEGFPILTSRKISFRIAFEETMFFLRGDTNTKKLEEKGINIWKGNTTKDFLNKRNLGHLEEGDMGKGYGYQWVSWEKYGFENVSTFQPINTKYDELVLNENGNIQLDFWQEKNPVRYLNNVRVKIEYINQIKEMLTRARSNPNDRKLVISAWNAAQLSDMALEPCHVMHQYQIVNGKLNSLWFQRSVDTMYGLPYNFMSYALLNILFSKYLNLEPGTLTFLGGDTHIYLNQLDIAQELLSDDRPGFDLPKLVIHRDVDNFCEMLTLEHAKDVELIGYKAHPDFKNKPAMAV